MPHRHRVHHNSLRAQLEAVNSAERQHELASRQPPPDLVRNHLRNTDALSGGVSPALKSFKLQIKLLRKKAAHKLAVRMLNDEPAQNSEAIRKEEEVVDETEMRRIARAERRLQREQEELEQKMSEKVKSKIEKIKTNRKMTRREKEAAIAGLLEQQDAVTGEAAEEVGALEPWQIRGDEPLFRAKSSEIKKVHREKVLNDVEQELLIKPHLPPGTKTHLNIPILINAARYVKSKFPESDFAKEVSVRELSRMSLPEIKRVFKEHEINADEFAQETFGEGWVKDGTDESDVENDLIEKEVTAVIPDEKVKEIRPERHRGKVESEMTLARQRFIDFARRRAENREDAMNAKQLMKGSRERPHEEEREPQTLEDLKKDPRFIKAREERRREAEDAAERVRLQKERVRQYKAKAKERHRMAEAKALIKYSRWLLAHRKKT